MEYEKHLYAVIYPKATLIASHYSPEQFTEHYISGSIRYYSGKLVFQELYTNFRNEWFKIDKGFEELKPHTDGRPKATKFICSYRLLEHISFEANPLHLSPIPGIHPAKLRDAIKDLRKRTWKRTKGLNLENILYKTP